MEFTERQKQIGKSVQLATKYWLKTADKNTILDLTENYDKLLIDYTADEICAAFDTLFKTERYRMPSPGEVSYIISEARREKVPVRKRYIDLEREARIKAHANLSDEQRELHMKKCKIFDIMCTKVFESDEQYRRYMDKFRQVCEIPAGIRFWPKGSANE